MTQDGQRNDQSFHDLVIKLVVEKRYRKEEFTTYANPNGEKNMSAGTVKGVEQYPDIVGISNNKPSIIAEIETENSVNEKESEQWLDYASLGLTFYLYVPQTKANDAKDLLNLKGLTSRIKGLRGYTIAQNNISIEDIFTN